MDRREFGKRAIGSAVALSGWGALGSIATGSLTSCKTATDIPAATVAATLPIVDTHQHLWDRTRFQPPWLKSAPEEIRPSHVTKDYLTATEGLFVERTIYMEIDVHPDDHAREAEHVIELSKSSEHPTCAAVISGRPGTETFRPHVERFAGSPYIKGFRQVLHVPETPKGHCLSPSFVDSMKLLGELGLNFDLCMRPGDLEDGLELARRCPGTRFVIDHCGNADPKAFGALPRPSVERPTHDAEGWKRDMSALAQLDNVYCKISGIIARAPKGNWTHESLAPIVRHCLDEFGPDRVVFGSDWPVCKLGAPLREWVLALRAIIADRSIEDQAKLLSKNADHVYRLA